MTSTGVCVWGGGYSNDLNAELDIQVILKDYIK